MDFLISFFTEVFNRLNSKSPKFFVVWQWFFAILTIITLIPQGLTLIGIELLGTQLNIISRVVAGATSLLWFMSKMPVKPTVLTLTTDGAVLQKTSEQKLPITAKDQKKEAVNNGLVGSAPLNEVLKSANT